jgi:hypothetical protein
METDDDKPIKGQRQEMGEKYDTVLVCCFNANYTLCESDILLLVFRFIFTVKKCRAMSN